MLYIKNKNAFTMIELVFVIVVLGILSAIAIPKFSATRDDAIISKGRSDISSIRSGIISERQARLVQGDSQYISGNEINASDVLFGNILNYGVISGTSAGNWENTHRSDASNTYKFYVKAGDPVTFTYTRATGKFTCDTSKADCLKLVK